MEEDMSRYSYPYMDPIQKEKLVAAARFRMLQYLRGAIKVLLFPSLFFLLCRFVLPLDPSESLLLNTLNGYISKRGMFLLCNVIFVFLAADSGTVPARTSLPPAHRESPLMFPPEYVGKELVASAGLEKEEAIRGHRSIVNCELGDNPVVAPGGRVGITITWEMVPATPLEDKELTLMVKEERRREHDDGFSGNFRSDEKIVLSGQEKRTASWQRVNQAVGVASEHAVATTWEVVPLPPPEEEEEFTFKVSEEGKRKLNDGSSGNFWLNQKLGSWEKEWRTTSLELVPVQPAAAELAEEESWDAASNEEMNKKFDAFIAKTRMSWRQESMQLVVV